MEAARARNLSGALLDRLKLDEKRVEGIARAIDEVVALAGPHRRDRCGMGPGRTVCRFSACACRWASSASFMRAGRTSQRTLARCA